MRVTATQRFWYLWDMEMTVKRGDEYTYCHMLMLGKEAPFDRWEKWYKELPHVNHLVRTGVKLHFTRFYMVHFKKIPLFI